MNTRLPKIQKVVILTKLVFSGSCLAGGLGLCAFDHTAGAGLAFSTGLAMSYSALLGCRYISQMDQKPLARALRMLPKGRAKKLP